MWPETLSELGQQHVSILQARALLCLCLSFVSYHTQTGEAVREALGNQSDVTRPPFWTHAAPLGEEGQGVGCSDCPSHLQGKHLLEMKWTAKEREALSGWLLGLTIVKYL